ncbi:MAG TPA: TetR/AcrR family transcriptional regulator [Planctomycetota bacterium]
MAARQLFATHGYHNTSVCDLFQEAGISKGALFHHWKSKEDLALAVFESLQADFETHFFSVAGLEGRAREKIENLLQALHHVSSDKHWLYGRIFALWCAELQPDGGGVGVAVHALRARWLHMWQELIRKAQQEHDLRADISPENLSFLVVSAISGVQLMSEREGTVNRAGLETLRRTLLT